MITTAKETHGLFVNLDGCSFYEDSKNYESNAEGNKETMVSTTRKQRQPDNINKNDNNEKNETNNSTSENKFSEASFI